MNKTKTERIAIRIEPSLKEKLCKSANAEGISYSEAVRLMIKEKCEKTNHES